MNGFLMNLDVAEEFFTRCTEREAIKREEREAILKELVEELKAVALNDEDVARYLKAKRCAYVTKKQKKDL